MKFSQFTINQIPYLLQWAARALIQFWGGGWGVGGWGGAVNFEVGGGGCGGGAYSREALIKYIKKTSNEHPL